MSKAVVFSEYGDADVLHVVDADPPQPSTGQIRVRVKAAGVQPFDCFFRSGAAQEWLSVHFPQRLGNEFAGVVDAVGDDVETFHIGDDVLGWAMLASYAEHVVVDAEQVVLKPEGMPWEEAGVLSASGQTAASVLKELNVFTDDVVLIHGAAGGVGTFAVQIALATGASVIGTARESNHDYLRSLGATPVAYGKGLTERVRALAPDGVDASLDTSGSVEALHASLEVTKKKGRIGTLAYQPAADELGIRRLSTKRSPAQLNELLDLYRDGKLRIVIQQAYPLHAAAEAHRQLETRHTRGKIVLAVE